MEYYQTKFDENGEVLIDFLKNGSFYNNGQIAQYLCGDPTENFALTDPDEIEIDQKVRDTMEILELEVFHENRKFLRKLFIEIASEFSPVMLGITPENIEEIKDLYESREQRILSIRQCLQVIFADDPKELLNKIDEIDENARSFWEHHRLEIECNPLLKELWYFILNNPRKIIMEATRMILNRESFEDVDCMVGNMINCVKQFTAEQLPFLKLDEDHYKIRITDQELKGFYEGHGHEITLTESDIMAMRFVYWVLCTSGIIMNSEFSLQKDIEM